MKKNNLFKVVALTILATITLSWFIPVSNYQEVATQGLQKIGLFDLFNYSTGVISYFGYIPLLLLAIGGFYGVLHKTKAYRNFIDSLVKFAKAGERWVFLAIIIVLFSVLGSIVGEPLMLMFFFPLVITIILAMGYDKITAILSTVGAVMVGFIGTTLSYSSMEAAIEMLSIETNSLIWWKVGLLVLSTVLLAIFTIKRGEANYNSKVKAADLGLPAAGPKKTKTWPIAMVFIFIFVLFVLGFINWSAVFNVTIFDTALKSMNEFTIGKVAILQDIFGDVPAFGAWHLMLVPPVLAFITLFTALFTKVSMDDAIEGYVSGMKKALKPAALSLMIYLVLMLSVLHPYVFTIISKLISSEKLNVLGLALASFVSNIFASDIIYTGQTVLPQIATVVSSGKALNVAGLVWQAVYGFSMLVVPTSVTLIATLSYLEVSYTKYIKSVWKFLLALLVLILVFALILAKVVI